MVDSVQAQDFATSTFAVIMSRVQQKALEKAGAPVAIPEQQLALINSRKQKKERTTLSCTKVVLYHLYQLNISNYL